MSFTELDLTCMKELNAKTQETFSVDFLNP